MTGRVGGATTATGTDATVVGASRSATDEAGRVTVAEVEELLPVGGLEPDAIHVPSIYVQRLVLGRRYEKPIERRTVRPR